MIGIGAIGKCRKEAGDRNAGDLLYYLILRVAYPSYSISLGKTDLPPLMPWFFQSRSNCVRDLGITIDQYKRGVVILKRTGLIEWTEPRGRACPGFRLSPKGDAWARGEGLLPELEVTQHPSALAGSQESLSAVCTQ
jgi:hypothetical protein